ncbi:hypothetical protein NUG22_25970 [Saccharothrix longispora]|nr:hypothetical protein [Saccharothrix longispora]
MSKSYPPAGQNPEAGDRGHNDPFDTAGTPLGAVGPCGAVGFDPDSVEGAAVMRLLRRYKGLEDDDPERSVSGGDAVELLGEWFHSLGVDLDDDPPTAAGKLRLAVRRRPGGSLRAHGVYSVRIGTDHSEPEHLVRWALRDLAERLGPGTGIDLSTCEGGLLARFEHAAPPQALGMPGPGLLDILQTLMATVQGHDADPVHLHPEQFARADRDGHPLIVIRRADGGVILTTSHIPHCVFVTSAGAAQCDCG